MGGLSSGFSSGVVLRLGRRADEGELALERDPDRRVLRLPQLTWGMFFIARDMKSRQIEAGKEPPVTVIPCTLVMAIWAFGYPTQTTVDAFGV